MRVGHNIAHYRGTGYHIVCLLLSKSLTNVGVKWILQDLALSFVLVENL